MKTPTDSTTSKAAKSCARTSDGIMLGLLQSKSPQKSVVLAEIPVRKQEPNVSKDKHSFSKNVFVESGHFNAIISVIQVA